MSEDPVNGETPYKMGVDGNREGVIKLFRASITEGQSALIREELKGKDLVCWCAPLACHADVLLEIANG